MKHLIPITALTLAGALSGCGDTGPGGAPALGFRIADGGFAGSYDPEVFSSKEVRQHLKTHCRPQVLASYRKDKPTSSGRIPFRATCKGAAQVPSGYVRAEKAADGRVVATTGAS